MEVVPPQKKKKEKIIHITKIYQSKCDIKKYINHSFF